MPDGAWQAAVYDGFSVGAAILATIAARRMTGVDRRVAGFIAMGCAAFALGNVLWDVYEVVLKVEVPEPSIADIAYVLGFPFFIAAAIALVRERTQLDWVNAVIDAVIVAMAAGLLVWEPVLIKATSNSFQAFVAGAYPVSDVVVVALLVVTLSARRSTPALMTLTAGILVNGVADFSYLISSSRAPYESGGWIDACFVAGPLIMACAAFAMPERPFVGGKEDHRPIPPVAATAVICIALVALPIDFQWAIHGSRGRSDATVRILLRVGLLGLVALRLIRQTHRLNTAADSLQTANTSLSELNTRLSDVNSTLSDVNAQLFEVNGELSSVNTELSSAMSRLASVMDAAEDAVFFVDTAGLLLESNPVGRAMFDLPEDATGTYYLRDHFPPEAVERVRETLGQDLTQPTRVVVPMRIHGDVRHMVVRATPVVGDDGAVRGVVLILHDQTQRIIRRLAAQSFAELEPSEALRAIAQPLRELIRFDTLSLSDVDGERARELARARFDAAGNVEELPVADTASTALTSRIEKRFRGHTTFVLRSHSPNNPGAHFLSANLQAAILVFLRPTPTEPLVGVLALGFADASGATDDAAALLADTAPALAAAVGNMRRYRAEHDLATHLREVDEVRDGFISMVAHEVRSPLGVISFAADVLQDHIDSEAQPEAGKLATGISQGARQLERLVSDLVEAGRGTFVVELEEVSNLKELTTNAALAGAALTDQIARLRLDIEPLPLVSADAGRFSQAITNLVTNALKFSEVDQKVEVRGRSDDAHVELSVIDRGVGITPEQESRLFKRFSRLGAKIDGVAVEGTGLGLFITQQVIAGHGGTLRYSRNDPERGSTFTIRLPIVTA